MTTRVKICGVRTPAAADAICAAGADAIGLVFYTGSARAVSVDQAAAVTKTVAPLVTTVGLFVDPAADDVWRVLEACNLDCLQFHGEEGAGFCEQFNRPYIRAISMRPDVDVAALVNEHANARAFLFDAWRPDAPGGTGEIFAWERIPRMDRPWILAGGLTADNVGHAIARVKPSAVDVSGGVESEVGVKDEGKVREFMSAVQRADLRNLEDARHDH